MHCIPLASLFLTHFGIRPSEWRRSAVLAFESAAPFQHSTPVKLPFLCGHWSNMIVHKTQGSPVCSVCVCPLSFHRDGQLTKAFAHNETMKQSPWPQRHCFLPVRDPQPSACVGGPCLQRLQISGANVCCPPPHPEVVSALTHMAVVRPPSP